MISVRFGTAYTNPYISSFTVNQAIYQIKKKKLG